ncbi:MAG: hypothetical protein R2695_03010 [Acidimicrobiales bacterium]
MLGTPEPRRLLGGAFGAAGIEWFGRAVRPPMPPCSAARSWPCSRWATTTSPVATSPPGSLRPDPRRRQPTRSRRRWERAAVGRGGHRRGAVARRLGRLVEDLEAGAERFDRDEEESWRAGRLRREAPTPPTSSSSSPPSPRVCPRRPSHRLAQSATWCRPGAHLPRGEALRESPRRAVGRAAHRRRDRPSGRPRRHRPGPVGRRLRRALELQLADDLGRHGSFGHGVLIGTSPLAIGLELDMVAIVGWPRAPTRPGAATIPSSPIRSAPSSVPICPPGRRVHDHHALLAVMAAATHTTMTFREATCAAAPPEPRRAGCSTPWSTTTG